MTKYGNRILNKQIKMILEGNKLIHIGMFYADFIGNFSFFIFSTFFNVDYGSLPNLKSDY